MIRLPISDTPTSCQLGHFRLDEPPATSQNTARIGPCTAGDYTLVDLCRVGERPVGICSISVTYQRFPPLKLEHFSAQVL